MVDYRRHRAADGIYFLTFVLRDRTSDLLIARVDALRDSYRCAAARVPHDLIAVVVMPDHIHALVRMRDDGGEDYSRLVQEWKKGFTRRVRASSAAPSPWQRRFWEHTIRDEADLQAHVAYIHVNPVKHGLVERVVDWPHSSFHRYVSAGTLPVDWGGPAEKSRVRVAYPGYE